MSRPVRPPPHVSATDMVEIVFAAWERRVTEQCYGSVQVFRLFR